LGTVPYLLVTDYFPYAECRFPLQRELALVLDIAVIPHYFIFFYFVVIVSARALCRPRTNICSNPSYSKGPWSFQIKSTKSNSPWIWHDTRELNEVALISVLSSTSKLHVIGASFIFYGPHIISLCSSQNSAHNHENPPSTPFIASISIKSFDFCVGATSSHMSWKLSLTSSGLSLSSWGQITTVPYLFRTIPYLWGTAPYLLGTVPYLLGTTYYSYAQWIWWGFHDTEHLILCVCLVPSIQYVLYLHN